MNTSGFRSSGKRTVLYPQHATPRVADVLFLTPLLRGFRVARTLKVRACSANQRSPLFGLGFLGRNAPGAVLPQFCARFFGSFVFTKSHQHIGVAADKMLLRRKAPQIFQSVVRLVAVDVVDVFGRIKAVHPTHCYHAVQQVLAANTQISVRMFARGVRAVLSENFPAARDGVIVVENPVLNTVNFKANHVVTPLVNYQIISSTT
jgi:hypothetical protein